MKFKKKKLISLGTFLVVVLLTSFAGYSLAGSNENVTLTNSPALFLSVRNGYNGGEKGPIQIVKGTLKKSSNDTKEAYLIMLSGTEFVNGQATGIVTDLMVGFNQDNDYLKAVVSAVSEAVPKDSNLIIAGHSLGGMVAQQLSGNKTIKKNYNILNVIAFGSPLINPIGREGTIKRLGDKADLVPYLSASGLYLPIWQIVGLNREDGGYTDSKKAHSESYAREDVWGNYDVLGIKNGSASFSYDETTITYYKAPSSIFPDSNY
ncbi:MAG: hypothetical protein K6G26_11000 [Lachnospiraceae bacterium]|nr:hypothetical protein [Lachnospiraceae bacterium]